MKKFLFSKRWISSLDEDEGGAALTEFAITLPIFVLLLTGLLHLGHLGQVTVAVKNVAYAEMWADAYDQTQNSTAALTPRSRFLDVAPGELSPVQMVESGSALVDASMGHWGESRLHLEGARALSLGGVSYQNGNSDAARRLREGPGFFASDQILGTQFHRPKFALDDDLTSLASMVGELGNVSGIDAWIGVGVGAILNVTGLGPGVLAGIRYGDGVGSASSEVTLSNSWLSHTETYQISYATALSPMVGNDNLLGSVGREQYQYMFYYLTGQTVRNKRVNLDVYKQQLDPGQNFLDPAPQYGP